MCVCEYTIMGKRGQNGRIFRKGRTVHRSRDCGLAIRHKDRHVETIDCWTR